VLEIAQIYRAIEQAGDEPCWLASVVSVEGSAYRRPGARMVFSRDGKLSGTISGGCLEREVLRTGAWLAQGGAILRTFDARRDEDGEVSFRSGCNGKVELLIEPVTDAVRATLALLTSELAAQRPVALATALAAGPTPIRLGAQLVCASNHSLKPLGDVALERELASKLLELLGAEPRRNVHYRRGSFQALLEVIEPQPHVSIFGTGEDAVPVARLAAQLGWNVSVRAEHGGFATRDRFNGVAALELAGVSASVARLSSYARALAVVMTHDYEQDREALGALLDSNVRYIGMLGPARRTQRMLDELRAEVSYPAERLACVYGPAGLHLGADTPEGIALSIVAELQAVLGHAQAGFLRSRSLGIHEQQACLRLLQAEGA
jgi:xanthine dehydrogenase accessory factor